MKVHDSGGEIKASFHCFSSSCSRALKNCVKLTIKQETVLTYLQENLDSLRLACFYCISSFKDYLFILNYYMI